MTIPPALLRSSVTSRFRRWIVDAIFNFDRREISDWLAVVDTDLAHSGGASPMMTARYVCQLIRYADDLRIAAQRLAIHGYPSGRLDLADAALDIRSAVESLHQARDALLLAAGTDQARPGGNS